MDQLLTIDSGKPIANLQQFVSELESKIQELPQAECNTRHYFMPGMYIRELTMPKGLLATGHYHRFDTVNIFVKGKMKVVNKDGSTSIIEAPQVFISPPGKKCGCVLEDVVWLNIFPTNITDVALLEEMYFDKSKSVEPLPAPLRNYDQDRADFEHFLNEYGVTAEFVQEQSERDDNTTPFPLGEYKVKVSNSPLGGKGLFATASIKEGDLIAPASFINRRTPAGRYTNHSYTPNARPVMFGEDIWFQAIRDIKGSLSGSDGEEIMVDYRECLDTSRRLLCQQ